MKICKKKIKSQFYVNKFVHPFDATTVTKFKINAFSLFLNLTYCLFAATGEPPLNMSVAVIFAIRNALKSARKDAGKVEDWFNLGMYFSQCYFIVN